MSHVAPVQPRPPWWGRITLVGVIVALLIAAAVAGILAVVGGSDRDRPQSAASPSSSVAPSAESTEKPSGVPPEAQLATVQKLVDGDTLAIRPKEPSESAQKTVRMLLDDTPETVHPNPARNDPHTVSGCFGKEASSALKQKIPVGTEVFVLSDQQSRDRYGRYLLYLWKKDGTFVNEQMVKEGFARVLYISPNKRYLTQMRAAQKDAQDHRRGLWAVCNPPASASPTAPSPSPGPTTSPVDTRYTSCSVAKSHGLGPYYKGQDPEYLWYSDGDGDGIACE